MDSGERVALVNRMVGLVNQLYLLETCCPQLSCAPKSSTQRNYAQGNNYARVLSSVPFTPNTQNFPQHKSHNCGIMQPKTRATTTDKYKSNARATSAYTPQEKPCFMIKCKPHKCRTNPDDEPLITWTPVMEIRKTTNPKNLERQNDNPITKYVYVEPPGCPYKPVWSTKDPMCEKHCGPPPEWPPLGPPPGYDGEPVELCCPSGGRGPPMDRWGQPYECKQTLDGRAICKPTKEEGPTDWCDAKTTPFRKCDTMMEESKRILTRGKVLNKRFKANLCSDREDSKRTTSLYKRPVWPKMETCNDGRCRCPNNPGNKRKLASKPMVQSRGLTFCCSEI